MLFASTGDHIQDLVNRKESGRAAHTEGRLIGAITIFLSHFIRSGSTDEEAVRGQPVMEVHGRSLVGEL